MSEWTRFWIEFDRTSSSAARGTPFVGVTAWTLEDAQLLVSTTVFRGRETPPILEVIQDVDVSELDEKHVQRNMMAPNVRGVWYPIGHSPAR
jgi:hypothetical protein